MPDTDSDSLNNFLAKCKSDVSWPTYLFVCLFGIGSWVAVNGLWVELPVFVQHAPEKWDLPSYLIVIIQLANIGPLLYTVGNHFFPRQVNEKPAVLFIVTIGATSCVLLAFFWDKTSLVGGVEHSTALLTLSFCLGIVDCTSSVVFLTFMAVFPASYLSALFVGETLSGMLPGFVALGQGIERNSPCDRNESFIHNTNNSLLSSTDVIEGKGLHFGPSAFFYFLFTMMVVCGFSFLTLNFAPFAKNQHVQITKIKPEHRRVEEGRQSLTEADFISCGHGSISSESLINTMYTEQYRVKTVAQEHHQKKFSRCTLQHIIYLLCIQAWISSLANGVLPSIQSYASEPYGRETYHLVVTLTSIASALICFIALWFPSRSSVLVTVCSCVYTLLSVYIILLAAMSPTPVLHSSAIGSVIVVTVSVAGGAIASYTKLTICTVMRDMGHRALFWCGLSIQAGSFIGALIMFPLVNVAKLFHQAKEQC